VSKETRKNLNVLGDGSFWSKLIHIYWANKVVPLDARKEVGVKITAERTKYILRVLSPHHRTKSLYITNKIFENVATL
jgi:hypothetical protein